MVVGQCTICKGQSSAGCQYCQPRNWENVTFVPAPKLAQGWECPKCQQVFSPLMVKCDKCGTK